MLRKILKVSLIVLGIGFISAYVRGYSYHTDKNINNQNKFTTNTEQTKKQDLIDEEIIDSILKVDSEENTTKVVEENITTNNDVKDEVISKKEVIKESNNTKEEIKDTKEENNNPINEDNTIIYEIKETVPEVDEEYLSIYNNCDYKKEEFNKCHTDSIDVALTDTINIQNTACKQFTYKGSIVGYKIQIFYRDGTWKYYNEK